MMADLIAGGLIAAVVLAAAFYVYKAKKSGKKCIGCPDSGCSGGCSGCCGGCHGHHCTLLFLLPARRRQRRRGRGTVSL